MKYKKNNMHILLISAQKLYFSDNDTVHNDITQEPIRNWHHNHRHEISRDPFPELLVSRTNAPIFISIDKLTRPFFTIRGPSSLV